MKIVFILPSHRHKIFLIGLFFMITYLHQSLKAETIDPSFFSISEGVASPNVMDIMQDSFGYIWIATFNGLQKYDGVHFETFKNIPQNPRSLMSNETWSLLEDADQNIWVSSALGISKFDRKQKTFVNYNLASLFNLSGSSTIVLHLYKDSNERIWASAVIAGLIYYDREKDTWEKAKSSSAIFENEVINLSFTEDKFGGLWTGVANGGLFYKSKSDSLFRPVNIPSSPVDFAESNNSISALYADEDNVLWLTTRTGVYKYYPNTGALKTLKSYNYNLTDRRSNMNSIRPDHEGNIWITNNFRGILKFDGISDHFQEVSVTGSLFMSDLGWDLVLADFTIDNSGIFWFGSWGQGLIKYDPEKLPFLQYTHDDNNPLSISNNAIFGLFASKINPDILYVGTRSGFLNIFHQKKQTFQHVKYNAVDDTYGGSVRSIGESNNGNIWLGTWGDGLVKMDKNYHELTRYKYDPFNEQSISDNKVRVLKGDDKGNFWVGTVNGLNYFQPATGQFTRIPTKLTRTYPQKLINQFEAQQKSNKSLAQIINVTDFKDLSQPFEVKEKGNYLVFTVGEGLDGSMADFGWIENAHGDTIWNSFDVDKTFYAGGDAKNRMLLEPIKLEAGNYTLRYLSDDSHSYKHWNAAPPILTSVYGIVIQPLDDPALFETFRTFEDQNNSIQLISGVNITAIDVHKDHVWIGTGSNGLNKINLSDHSVKTYLHDPNNENSLGNNRLLDVLEDKYGFVWITSNGGLDRFDPENQVFTHFTEEDGLPTNYTESILEGDNGEMWISTDSGLSQMITSGTTGKVTFINFNAEDGLGGDTYVSQVAARTADGKFYFGGDHGLNAISSVVANNIPPTIVLSNLYISNRSIFDMGDDSPLSNDINNTESIALSHQQNNLSFEYAALHYANPQKNQYAHFLKGYDEDWVYDNRNFASYTNLDPGEYTFSIRASNAYGVWNEAGKSIHIVIAPPWWRTWWAYVGYALIFIGFIFGLDRIMRRRVMLQERERNREKELAQAREIEKAYQELKATQTQLVQAEKMASLGELTAGIAHEIQNPLNFVNNFSDVSKELLEELKEEIANSNYDEVREIANDVSDNLEKILHHGKRADAIVKNMLLHSRGNSGQKEPTDINALADEYLRLSFHGLRARDKSFNADFKLETAENLPKIKVVPQDIGRVMLNLINNAFYAVNDKNKHQDNGYKPMVVVSTRLINQDIEIKVTDNGNGIPDTVKEKIFQPFFTTKPTGQGTGLGLSLSYDIIKAHKGELLVQSKENEGTEMIIQLPLS